MRRVATIFCASAFAFGCGTQDDADDDTTTGPQEVNACVRVSGVDIGNRVTVEVPSVDATLAVTFTRWIPKVDEPDGYVGFGLDLNARFNVDTGFEIFTGVGSQWMSPYGASGNAAAPIISVELCTASPDGNPPPPADDGSGGDGSGGDGSGSDGNCHGFC